jgi:cellulose synthase (UDP-forming)
MPFPAKHWVVRAVALVAVAVSVYYLSWRALHTFNPHALWLSLLLFVAECYGLLMFMLHMFLTWDTRSLERSLGLTADQRLEEAATPAPISASVDVFIPTYNESVSLLRKSVLAARGIRLEHATWVLDDGRRSDVQAMCEELGVGYLTRDSNEHAKAGNINAALPRTSGEFIVVLDADFIALPDLLERTLGYFHDERLAFVQLPQAFYNVDSIQHVGGDIRTGWHEQTLFYDVIQPGKNRWNAAFWCGSPAVLRRAALESVGGAAIGTITEDILTSMRLHANGWRSLYHNEILAVGVAPGDLDGFRTQRLRWAQGSMQILRSHENPLLKRGLTLAQRVNYLASMTTYFQAVQLAVLVAMPTLVLITGQSPIANLGSSFFILFAPYLVLTLTASKLMGGARQRLLWDQYFSFLRLFTFLRALPVLLFGGKRLRFRVTPKSPSGPSRRASLYPHIGVALINLAVIIALLVRPTGQKLSTVTVVMVAVCAAAIAGTYLLAVARLWRRVYRRHHYRFAVELPVQVEIDGRVVSCRASGERYRVGVEFAPLALEDERYLLLSILQAAVGASRPASDQRAVLTPAPRLADA